MIRPYKENDYERFCNELLFWSNEKGDFHYHGERFLNICDLPEALRNAYRNLWNKDTGSYCYLVEYKGEYFIALSNTYSEDYAAVCEMEFSEMYEAAFKNAVYMDTLLKKSVEYILMIEGDKKTHRSHEMIALINPLIKRTDFDKIADIIYENAYKNI